MPAYLAAAAKLYEVASPPQPFSAELALRLLLKHTFDAAAATHQLATYIGVEKVLRPEPVKARPRSSAAAPARRAPPQRRT